MTSSAPAPVTVTECLFCHVGPQLLADNADARRPGVMTVYGIPGNRAFRVFVGGNVFPHTLARVFEYGLSPYTVKDGVVYPESVGIRVTDVAERLNAILGPASLLPRNEKEVERFYYNHGDEVIRNWKGSGCTDWTEPNECLCPDSDDDEEAAPAVVDATGRSAVPAAAQKRCAIDTLERLRIRLYLANRTIMQGRLLCDVAELTKMYKMSRPALETMIRDYSVLVRAEAKLGLGFEVQTHEALIEMVAEKNALPTGSPLYSFVMYFDASGLGGLLDVEAVMGFPCLVVPNAERVTVENAMEIIFKSEVPVYFFGCEALREPGAFTLSMVDWPAAARGVIPPFAPVLPLPQPEVVHVDDAEPRTLSDALLTSDASHRYIAPHRKRFVYTLGSEMFDSITFYVSGQTTAVHLAYAQAHARVTFVIVNRGRGEPQPRVAA